LIKHKLAEMAIRAYVGESILYRTLGMIDEALEQADKDDPSQVLRVLEQFAIECSIIKVWESEALAYVVDEEVQVFGGYGYSKEYPAERAYRDARIARIYEGTNEINRIVIGTQLMRRAASGELALFEAAESAVKLRRSAGDTLSMNTANLAFTEEVTQVRSAKAMTLASISAANKAYGDRARNEQEVIALIADMVMDVYAIESALLRTQRLLSERGLANCGVQADITRVFARDAALRIEKAARAVASEVDDEETAEAIDQFAQRSPMKSIAARRRIADAVINAGRYPLS
jgi:alkylation response protein AidB-like acyl-CoA dehydrogenase